MGCLSETLPFNMLSSEKDTARASLSSGGSSRGEQRSKTYVASSAVPHHESSSRPSCLTMACQSISV